MHLVASNTPILRGKMAVPASKSHTIRGIFLGALISGESKLIHPLEAEDIRDALSVCRELGVTVSSRLNQVTLMSMGLPFEPLSETINTGNSGITSHFLLPLLGLRHHPKSPVVVTCGAQMRARPIDALVNALRGLGLTVTYLETEARLPVSISGSLCGGDVEVAGSSSQPVSALLMTLPFAQQDSVLRVKQLHERPYVMMTLAWLSRLQITIEHQTKANEDRFYIPARQTLYPFQAPITGDFSTAAVFIAAAVLLPGRVEVIGLDMQDAQGDKRLVDILKSMGANISVLPNGLTIEGGAPLTGLTIDANDIPDLVPVLAVIGTQAFGKTSILNVPEARCKETDRIHAMVDGLTRLGAIVEEFAEGLCVHQSQLHGTCVKGYGDHRTVMAMTLAGLCAKGSTNIDESESIEKTCPNFISLMQQLGAHVAVNHA